MWTKRCCWTRLLVSMNAENWLRKRPGVKANNVPAFSCANEIEFWLTMPLQTFYIFVNLLFELVLKLLWRVSNVDYVEMTIIASRSKNLLVNFVPSYRLNLIIMEVWVNSFALSLFKVPDTHSLICRSRQQILPFKLIQRQWHNCVGVGILRYSFF